jgi:hypothetical protein
MLMNAMRSSAGIERRQWIKSRQRDEAITPSFSLVTRETSRHNGHALRPAVTMRTAFIFYT